MVSRLWHPPHHQSHFIHRRRVSGAACSPLKATATMSLSLAVKNKRCWQQHCGRKSSSFALLRPAAEMKLTCNVWRNIINLTDCRLMILLDSELRVAFAFAETLCECAAVSPREIHRQNSQKPDGFQSQSTGAMTKHAILFFSTFTNISCKYLQLCLIKGPQ